MAVQLKEERQRLTLQMLRDHERVTVAELSRRFDVSEVTVRRDLREMDEEGLLQRAHGGAVTTAFASPEPPVVRRMGERPATKRSIGRAAAALVADGESIFISAGSTTAYVARNLVDREGLTVVTNALNIATELASARGVTVVVTGGMMRGTELSLVGHIADQALHEVRVDKVIMAVRAISLEDGITNDYLPEVITDRTIIDMAPELIVVADHTKFGQVASAFVAPTERISTIVTDSELDPEMLAHLEGKGVRVVLVDGSRSDKKENQVHGQRT